MATLKEKIDTDFQAARLAHDDVRKAALETVKALLLTLEKAPGRNGKLLDDEEVTSVVTKAVKQYNESLEAFKKVGNVKQVLEIEAEIFALKPYLPQLMSFNDIERELQWLLGNVGAENVGKLMGLFNKKFPKKADNKLVKEIAETLFPHGV